ncbi:sensor histidine kinase [Halobacillus sp. B23F22_1]|uniref:sensor histidine kinase n=1 Tax=Halobacillus sp. B23F22_1 TaxID=3459514 RepID=UPI00373F930E
MKIQNRIHLFTSVLFVILLILINVAIYFSFSRILFSSEIESTSKEAEHIIEELNYGTNDIPITEFLRAYVPVNGMVQIIDEAGQVDAGIAATEGQDLQDRRYEFYREEKSEIIEFNNEHLSFVSIPIIWQEGEVAALQVTERMTTTEQNLTTLRYVLLVATVIGILPLFISARLLSNVIIRPIASMTKTMKEIREGGHFKRIDLSKRSRDELHTMVLTFNEMMDLLESNYEKQERFVSNASHELKTPLTVIESYSSLLKRRGKNNEKLFDEAVEAIHSEAIRMKELTVQLLTLAKKEEQWNVMPEKLELNEVVEESVQSFNNAYGHRVIIYLENEVIVNADEQKLKQLLYIFMDNARKYSDGRIDVRVGSGDNYGRVDIVDRGIGIAEEELDNVFDRFYRVDRSRERKIGGFGLGLSLAKEIAGAMNIKLVLKSEPGIGTQATIKIPLSH